jgi:hypothetical protein
MAVAQAATAVSTATVTATMRRRTYIRDSSRYALVAAR